MCKSTITLLSKKEKKEGKALTARYELFYFCKGEQGDRAIAEWGKRVPNLIFLAFGWEK